jgi:hypothetical protein
MFIGIESDSQMWPPLADNFLAIWVWNVVDMGAILNDK